MEAADANQRDANSMFSEADKVEGEAAMLSCCSSRSHVPGRLMLSVSLDLGLFLLIDPSSVRSSCDGKRVQALPPGLPHKLHDKQSLSSFS
jgi:hypothetical protein